MRKIFKYVEKFIICHYKLSLLVASSVFTIGCIASVYSRFIAPAAGFFAFSLASLLRLITYKTGKIPFIIIDKTWDKYRLKYSEENLSEEYKKMCIKRATIYLMIAIVFLLIWSACEIVSCFV